MRTIRHVAYTTQVLSKYIHVILYRYSVTIVSDWYSFIAYFTEKCKELYLCGVVLQAESF